MKATDKNSQKSKADQENKLKKDHTSEGHHTGAKGSATSSKEPTLRSSTTDSSRAPKNPNDDMPTGGNIR